MISVKVNNISKSYGNIRAINKIDLQVSKGEIFGLIGADGAGKTTLFKILVTSLLPDIGSAEVEGLDVVKQFKDIRKIIGYMPGKFSLYSDLSIEENLKFFASVYGTTIQENYELIKDIYIQIEPFKKRKAGKLSGGMKQKLALSCALIHKPKVLFLDEPTTGVDAVSRKEFWNMLKKLKDSGITILVSTPYMDEALLCDRIALIESGNILAIDTPSGITENYSEKIYAVKSLQIYQLIKTLRNYPETKSCYAFGEYAHLVLKDNTDKNEILAYLKGKIDDMVEIKEIRPTIEDSFIALLNKNNQVIQ